MKIQKFKIASAVGAATMAVTMVALGASNALISVFANTEEYSFVGGNVTLDGINDGEITVDLTTATGGAFTGFEGTFATHETNDENEYITLTGLTPGGEVTPMNSNIEDGVVVYADSQYTGFEVSAGGAIWSATYTVDKDTPTGDYTVTLTNANITGGASGFEGENLATKTATISVERQVNVTPQIEAISDQTYNGTEIKVEPVVTAEVGDNTVTLVKDTDYTVAYSAANDDFTSAGQEVTVTVSSVVTSDYKFDTPVTTTYNINQMPVEASGASLSASNFTYSGDENKPIVTVVVTIPGGEVALTEGTDYNVEYSTDTVNAGSKTVTVTAKGNYSGQFELPYTVSKAEVIPVINVASGSVFNGTAQTPEVTVTATLNSEPIVLVKDTDYTVSYSNNTDAGTSAAVALSMVGSSNYIFSEAGATTTFTIAPYTLTDSNVTLEYYSVRVNGAAKEPAVLSVKIGDFVVPTTDYSVSYSNNTEVSTPSSKAAAIITPTGANYDSAPVNVYFDILDTETLVISGIEDQSVVYTGSPVELVGTLTVGANTDNITVSDLTTTWYDNMSQPIERPTAVGAYTVVYGYSGTNYSGYLPVHVTITKAESGYPVEADGFTVASGTKLNDIDGDRTTGFAWVDGTTEVAAGNATYAATYTKNNHTDNYKTTEFNVAIYGRKLDLVHEVLEGKDQVVALDKMTGTVDFRIDADFALFNDNLGRVYINNVLVDPSQYIASPGSTILSFDDEFIATLGVGTHTLMVEFNDGGIAETTFTLAATIVDDSTDETDVADPVATPDTGAFTGGVGVVAGVIILPAILGVGAIIFRMSHRKKIDFTR